MAGRNIGKMLIYILVKLTHSLLFSSFCGVSTHNFILYPSSQASADPTSDVFIVALSFSIYLISSKDKLIQPSNIKIPTNFHLLLANLQGRSVPKIA